MARATGLSELILPALLGGIAGAAVGFAVFKGFEYTINKQLEAGGAKMLTQGERALREEAMRLIDQEVPPKVRAAVDSKLREFGITPTTGRQIATVLDRADRLGII